MKNLTILKYIMNLSEKDRTVALLIIGVSALWMQGIMGNKAFNQLQEDYRVELIKRSDSCDAQKMKILMNNIENIAQTQRMADSLAKANFFIIKENNRNIKIVKKSK